MNAKEMRGQRIAIVGGGLAGIAAAEALSRFPFEIHLFEAKRSLGGRAGAFREPDRPSLIDRCQHVAMGCCTNFLGLCQRLDLKNCFRRDTKLHFIDRDGKLYPFTSNKWLPAPLHLAGAFQRQKYLSTADQQHIRAALWEMAPPKAAQTYASYKMRDWLLEKQQSETAIAQFWEIVLVSALGAPLSEVSFTAARKVFVDGFLRNRQAYQVYVPTLPLQDIFDVQAAQRLGEKGVHFHRQSPVRQVAYFNSRFNVRYGQGAEKTFENFIAAIPWHQSPKIFSPILKNLMPKLDKVDEIESSPISSVHLWLDRPLTKLPHAVLLDRTSQWVFNHGSRLLRDTTCYYYQVVISASQALAGLKHEDLARQVFGELVSAFGANPAPYLLDQQVVTEKQAVFAATPDLEGLRPNQGTILPGLALAGDWTKTGWPSTMEGAVRSGYLAAEAILRKYGYHDPVGDPDLPVALISKWLWGLGKEE
ncbi:phytoene dehydrogenase [Bremerella cremea]|uniref:Phytoene dehydrogenase n=1 Tax=Bremerella cremea TaxID=1031537 RepID=A0A368KQZ8_9BACT|nr:hydroxysqualene dehydroxylase HpnE [Bremerella cremea]RCS49305.1 phytoene dehydrogenase [Bremerella cremea]